MTSFFWFSSFIIYSMIELNHTDTALVVIDVQIAQRPIFNEVKLVQNINNLIEMAQRNNVYTIYIQHAGRAGSDFDPERPGFAFLPELKLIPNPVIIQKRFIDSFIQTPLQSLLDSRKIKNLIICGIQTENCVDTAIRVGFHLGYKIVVPEDAHSTQISSHLTPDKVILHHQLIWFPSFAKQVKTREISFK
jgi:nicotinamidase-related amidase